MTRLTGDSRVTFTGRVDDVFRALAEPARRRLLDRLVEQDGLTLRELCAVIPELHSLRRDEASGRARSRAPRDVAQGRPREAPLLEPRADPRDPRPVDLEVRRALGGRDGRPQARPGRSRAMAQPRHVFETYIKASQDRIWQALIDPELTSRYFFDARVARRGTWARPTATRSTDARGRGRGRRSRSAEAARAVVPRAVRRRHRGRTGVAGDVGDHAGRIGVPSHVRPQRPLRCSQDVGCDCGRLERGAELDEDAARDRRRARRDPRRRRVAVRFGDSARRAVAPLTRHRVQQRHLRLARAGGSHRRRRPRR